MAGAIPAPGAASDLPAGFAKCGQMEASGQLSTCRAKGSIDSPGSIT